MGVPFGPLLMGLSAEPFQKWSGFCRVRGIESKQICCKATLETGWFFYFRRIPMTNFERIKLMNLEQMAAMFYIFARPFMEATGMSKEQKEEAAKNIRAFLSAEEK